MTGFQVGFVRMYLLRPHLRPDPERPCFYDGTEQADARLPFQCAACGAEREVPLQNEVGRGVREFDVLKYVWSSQLPHWFGCSEEAGRIVAPDGAKAWFAAVQCTTCRREHVLCFSFHEFQPARMVGTLHGAALVVPGDGIPAPLLAMRGGDGAWGLRFPNGDLCNYESRVDGVAEAMRDLRVFTLDAHGLHWDGGHRSPSDLHVESHSLAPGSREHARWLHASLPLGTCVIEHSERYRTRHEIALTLRPFDPLPLHLAETIGQGVAADGGEFAFAIGTLRTDAARRSDVVAAGCDWVLAVVDAHTEDSVALQRLVEAVLARGKPVHVPDATAFREASVAEDHGDDRPREPEHGWWAAPDEPPLYYITKAKTAEGLADEIAVVVAEMREQRGRDHVEGGDTLCFLSNGTQGKLHVTWYEPASGAAYGDWRYTVMLRHLEGDLDADEIESFAYDAAVIWALAEFDAHEASGEPVPPTVYFLREFDREPSPLFVEEE